MGAGFGHLRGLLEEDEGAKDGVRVSRIEREVFGSTNSVGTNETES